MIRTFYKLRPRTILSALFLVFVLPSLFASEDLIVPEGNLDWTNMRISTSLKLDLSKADIRQPAGRTSAEEAIFSQFLRHIRPFIMSIPVDSSTILGELVDRGEIPPAIIDGLSQTSKKTQPVYTTDFKCISSSYIIDLKDVASRLLRHTRADKVMHLVVPPPAPSYTGIVIIADDELPAHGKKTMSVVRPCLFPKIWDTEMNLIFDKTMTEPISSREGNLIVYYTDIESIFADTPSGISTELEKVVGERPLRIIARGVFGKTPTDPVIDKDDALLIISNEENVNLLRSGRIALIVQNKVLNTPLLGYN